MILPIILAFFAVRDLLLGHSASALIGLVLAVILLVLPKRGRSIR